VKSLGDARQRASDKIKARLEEKKARGETIYSSDEEWGEGGTEDAGEAAFDEEESENLVVPPVPPMANPKVKQGGREGGREGGRGKSAAGAFLSSSLPPSLLPSLPPSSGDPCHASLPIHRPHPPPGPRKHLSLPPSLPPSHPSFFLPLPLALLPSISPSFPPSN